MVARRPIGRGSHRLGEWLKPRTRTPQRRRDIVWLDEPGSAIYPSIRRELNLKDKSLSINNLAHNEVANA